MRNENSNNTSCQTLNLGITSTTDNDIEIDFSIFPNPTPGTARCQLQNYLPQNGVLSIFNLQGYPVLKENIRIGATNINLENQTPGTYIYELSDGDKLLKTGKIIKL